MISIYVGQFVKMVLVIGVSSSAVSLSCFSVVWGVIAVCIVFTI